jgi:glycosyltransferase 2 family protein
VADSLVSEEPSSPAASAPRSLAVTLLQIAVSAGLLFWLLRGVGAESWSALRSVHPGAFAAAVASILLAQLFTSLRLRALLAARGVVIGVGRAFQLTMGGYFASNFLPGTIGGDLLKGAVLLRDGAGRRTVVTALVLDRLLNLFAILALGVLSLALGGLPVQISALPWRWAAWILAAAIVITVVGFAALRGRAERAATAVRAEIASWSGAPATVAFGAACSFLCVLSVVAGLWLLFRGLGLHVGPVSVCALLTAANLLSLLPVSLNGLGVQEVSLSYLLTLLGAPPALAVGAALLVRLVTLTSSAFGVAALARLKSAGR